MKIRLIIATLAAVALVPLTTFGQGAPSRLVLNLAPGSIELVGEEVTINFIETETGELAYEVVNDATGEVFVSAPVTGRLPTIQPGDSIQVISETAPGGRTVRFVITSASMSTADMASAFQQSRTGVTRMSPNTEEIPAAGPLLQEPDAPADGETEEQAQDSWDQAGDTASTQTESPAATVAAAKATPVAVAQPSVSTGTPATQSTGPTVQATLPSGLEDLIVQILPPEEAAEIIEKIEAGDSPSQALSEVLTEDQLEELDETGVGETVGEEIVPEEEEPVSPEF